MVATEVFANNPSTTVISGGTDAPASGTTEVWTVASNFGWPTASTGSTQFHVGDPAAPSEVILVTNMSGTTWNVTRGAESSVPVVHAANFTIAQVVTAGWLGSVSFLNPMTSPGDMIAGTVSGLGVRVAGNTSSTKEFLTSTGAAGTAQTPVWGAIQAADVPTLNQNTTGTSSNVTGTVATTHGGTGLGAVGAYEVVTGGATSTSPLQTVASVGGSGQVLTSQGAGVLPVWTSNVGGTVPLPVTVGGTGGTQVSAYAVVTGGTSATAPMQQVTGGTAGQVLTSNGAGVLPSWTTLSGGSIISFPITVSEGGTGGTQATAYALFAGGTAATSPLQQVASIGGSGQVLTSQGSGKLPTWAASVTFPVTILEGGTGGTTATQAITNLGAADLTSAQTLITKTLRNTSLTFNQLGTVSTSQSITCANGNVQELTLGTSVTISSITGPGGTVACDLTLYIVQAASGGPYTINSWPASVNWLGGGAPTIQSGSGAVTVVTMESLNGGTAWYGAQITGAPALPLDIPLGGTGESDSNDALGALAGGGVLSILGNGSDGAAVFDGSTTPVAGATLSGSTYTMTRDILTTSVQVNSGVTLTTSSATGTFRIFSQGTVTTIAGGTISAAGNAASGATAGAVLASGSLVGGRAGGAGGIAGTGQGGNGSGANMGVAGGTGGTAGASGGLAGTAGTVTQSGTNVVTNVFNTPFPVLNGICMYGGNTLQVGWGAGGSGGGGASGFAGGGGGGGGGIVAMFAYSVVNNGMITAAGGAGGAGAGGNAGGGGGGAGGLIIAYTLAGFTEGTTNVAGGTGGTGPGSGANGSAGGAGSVVSVVLTN